MRTLLFLIVAVVVTAQAVSFFELVKEEWTTFKVYKLSFVGHYYKRANAKT